VILSFRCGQAASLRVDSHCRFHSAEGGSGRAARVEKKIESDGPDILVLSRATHWLDSTPASDIGTRGHANSDSAVPLQAHSPAARAQCQLTPTHFLGDDGTIKPIQ
jgi:hypothetical protein